MVGKGEALARHPGGRGVASERLDEAVAAVRQAFDGGKITLAEHLLFDPAIKTAERSMLASSGQADAVPTEQKAVRQPLHDREDTCVFQEGRDVPRFAP